jgi:hypothetical protein
LEVCYANEDLYPTHDAEIIYPNISKASSLVATALDEFDNLVKNEVNAPDVKPLYRMATQLRELAGKLDAEKQKLLKTTHTIDDLQAAMPRAIEAVQLTLSTADAAEALFDHQYTEGKYREDFKKAKAFLQSYLDALGVEKETPLSQTLIDAKGTIGKLEKHLGIDSKLSRKVGDTSTQKEEDIATYDSVTQAHLLEKLVQVFMPMSERKLDIYSENGNVEVDHKGTVHLTSGSYGLTSIQKMIEGLAKEIGADFKHKFGHGDTESASLEIPPEKLTSAIKSMVNTIADTAEIRDGQYAVEARDMDELKTAVIKTAAILSAARLGIKNVDAKINNGNLEITGRDIDHATMEKLASQLGGIYTGTDNNVANIIASGNGTIQEEFFSKSSAMLKDFIASMEKKQITR